MKAGSSRTLAGLTRTQWEALCDGCAKCCVQKLIDESSGEVLYTNVACRLLNLKTCRCKRYAVRHCGEVECVELTPDRVSGLDWMPETCAYRLVAAGKPLPAWHPLITGDRRSTERAGMSMKGRLVDERDAGPIEGHVIFVQKSRGSRAARGKVRAVPAGGGGRPSGERRAVSERGRRRRRLSTALDMLNVVT